MRKGRTKKTSEELMVKKFFSLNEYYQPKEAHSTPRTRNMGKTTKRAIILKLLKTSRKDKLLKVARKKYTLCTKEKDKGKKLH